jgi:hypothetical protein
MSCRNWSILTVALLSLPCSWAVEGPFFITYTHQMEEPGNLEIATKTVTGRPIGGNRFLGVSTELEYGIKAWWTSEWYFDGQATSSQSALFTGYRWENRFRLLPRERWINPVLYVEFENINGADKSLLEVVGHDGAADLTDPHWLARQEKKREIELKLILGSNFKGWNLSENLIFEKNLDNSPWEFGYAVGVSRPLKLAASARKCSFCAQRFAAGLEMYGGLGDRYTPGLRDTSHYLGPAVNWSSPSGLTLSFSPQFGLNDNSVARLYRFGISYEISQVFGKLGFHRKGNGKEGNGKEE